VLASCRTQHTPPPENASRSHFVTVEIRAWPSFQPNKQQTFLANEALTATSAPASEASSPHRQAVSCIRLPESQDDKGFH
jgi:hypothetical protein